MNPKIATITLNPALDRTLAIPNFQAGAVNRVEWEQTDPGGKGINVASFLADFDFEVTASGFLGKDNQALFHSFLTHKGIENRFLSIPGQTRVNLKIIDAVQSQVTDINSPGPVVTAAELTQLDSILNTLMDECDWFVLSGSLPAGVSPDIYGKWIARLKALGKTVILDASGESLRQGIPFAPDVIKPNLDELQEVLGQRLDGEKAIAQAAQTLVSQGIPSVVISMGSQGALFAEAGEMLIARPPQIKVISTVGAGDAMVAGFITGKLRQLSLGDCAKLATAFAMGALSQIGPHLPPPATLEAWMNQVTVSPLHQPQN